MALQVNNGARKRRIRNSALWLGLLALGFYVVFIALSVMRSRGGS
jgi:lipopolysaccharide export LptBFGC system permease protein LptF